MFLNVYFKYLIYIILQMFLVEELIMYSLWPRTKSI